jgi:transposase
MVQLSQWKSEQMVFVDESAANERTADRKWGWAPIGMPCIFEQALKRTKKWSLLPAYTVEGFLTWGIQRGSYHKEDFNDFIRYRVLPLMNPYPHEQNSILVMDNARIHKSDVLLSPTTLIEQELENMCYEAGVLLEYLPPYSPDFNPIELAFGRLKMWFKRNMQLCEAMDDMEAFIEMGMRQQLGSARGFFRKSQIGTALDETLDEA